MTWSVYTKPQSTLKDAYIEEHEHQDLQCRSEGIRNIFQSILADEPSERPDRPICLPTDINGILLFKRAFTVTTISPQDAISVFHDIRKLILSIPWDTEQCEVTFTTALHSRLYSLSTCRVKDPKTAIEVLDCILTHTYESKRWWTNQTHAWATYLVDCLEFADDGFPIAALRRQVKQTLTSLNIHPLKISSSATPMVHPDAFIMAITAAVSRGILATGLNFQVQKFPQPEPPTETTTAQPDTDDTAESSPTSLDDLLPDCESEKAEESSSSSEEMSPPVLKLTRHLNICRFFSSKGSCRYGDRCRDVHVNAQSDSSDGRSSVEDLEAFIVQPHEDCDLSTCHRCKTWFHSVIKMPGICMRCLKQGHSVSKCTGEISNASARCNVCGFPKHPGKQCHLANSGICSRCKERGHKPSACPRDLPSGKTSIETLFSRGPRRRL